MYYVPVYALIKIVANMTWVSCVCVICVVHMCNVCVYVLVHMSVLVCMFVLCVHACVHDYVRVHANLSSGGGAASLLRRSTMHLCLTQILRDTPFKGKVHHELKLILINAE